MRIAPALLLVAGCSGHPVGSSSGAAATSSTGTSSSGSSGSFGGGSPDAGAPPGWTLVWSDEFNGPDGGDVDPTKWVHAVSGDGNGNQELEYYTPGPANAYLGGGYLHLVADALPPDGGGFTCWYGPCQYTSGKIVTKAEGAPALFQQQYGRFSARMKIPAGQGMWPAFWMLGSNIDQVNWPTCGEIDVMENIGETPATDYGTVHGPDAQGANAALSGNIVLDGGALADDFHVYSVEWSPGQVIFLLDDTPYFTATKAAFLGSWVFDDHPFYLLLNLAIGGVWPGPPDSSTVFPAEVLVDWVRVYDPTP
jgi:beta-glucanase (GH16 family)